MLLFLPCHIVVRVRSTTHVKRFAALRVVGRWLHRGLLSCGHRLRGLSCVPCICSGVQERQSTARVYLRSYLLPPLSSLSYPHLRLLLPLNSHFPPWNCVCPADLRVLLSPLAALSWIESLPIVVSPVGPAVLQPRDHGSRCRRVLRGLRGAALHGRYGNVEPPPPPPVCGFCVFC